MFNLRLLTAFLILLILLAATWILADISPSEPARTDRIVFVSDDHVIHTIRPNGSGLITISPDIEAAFTWPSWSPDSRKLVYSVVTGGGEDDRMRLLVSDAGGGKPTEIYAGEPGVSSILAQSVVHFPLWSPDSSKIAFIAPTMSGLSLFLDDLSDNPNANRILDNGPLWISWSPDSRHLLAHRADEYFLIDSGTGLDIQSLGIADRESRVPAWSPDGTSFYTAQRAGRGQYHILRSDVSGGEVDAPRRLLTTSPIPAYLWSPDGRHLSIANFSRAFTYRGLTMDLYGGISVYSDPESGPIYLVRDPTIAHFWSPDGRKIAYVGLSETQGVLRWIVLDIESGERTALVDFVPSVAQLTMFQFFDQYSYSHSLWSPDSDALVFAGILSSDAATASLRLNEGSAMTTGAALVHGGSHVNVVGMSGESAARVIADGFMAAWSPN